MARQQINKHNQPFKDIGKTSDVDPSRTLNDYLPKIKANSYSQHICA